MGVSDFVCVLENRDIALRVATYASRAAMGGVLAADEA